tara:strand:- start:4031 stop:4747 length:717 start_codon:yes stop_codon:yes gene_type:complete
MQKILGIDTNAKTIKGQKKGFLTGICYLAPSDASGVMNTCPNASKGCREACLFTAGRGAMSNVRDPRIAKTVSFHNDPAAWMAQLAKEITALVKRAKKNGLTPCVRLNGTSDIAWEDVAVGGEQNIMRLFPNVQFYDYSKRPLRVVNNRLPNYHLTFSRSESNEKHVQAVLGAGTINVAVVFRKTLPATFYGRTVVNGDESDLRFLDPVNVVVGLVDKGKAKKDETGFVVEPNLDKRG